jgi:hypothetical protein
MDTTNEPVAWIGKDELQFGFTDTRVTNEKESWDDIPLYTHPVNPKYDPETGEPLIDGYPLFSGLPHPVKELTDEEIEEVFYATHFTEAVVDTDFMDFARAILRKAQEK